MGLTKQQEAFAVHLAAGMSKTEAYLAVYDHKGTRKTAQETASKLAKNPKVAAKVAALQAPANETVQRALNVDLTACLFENARIGFSDVRRLFHEDGRMKQPHEWDDDVAAAVSSIKVRELFGEGKDGVGAIGTVTEVKLWDKGAAQDRLLRHFGAYAKDNAQRNNPFEGASRDAIKRFLATALALDAAVGEPAAGSAAGADRGG